MSDPTTAGFGKFVPGFDFLQNIAKGATQAIPQLPNLSNWVAPTLNVEELEKRIEELRAVHFWLDQNSKALAATIQALEVQKMTLATLKGMNFNMGDVANALKLKAADTMAGGVQKATQAASDVAGVAKKAAGKGKDGSAMVDPLQWWGALTQQFQQIASDAMKDVARNTAVDTARHMATGAAREAMKGAGKAMKSAPTRSGAKPARKAAGKRSTARKTSR